MARLFITPREIAFINDIAKEFTKDIVGQVIFYYPVSTLKTRVHPVYDEAVQKIFENPIKVDVLAGQPEWETRTNIFGSEQSNKIEIFISARDLLDKGYEVSEGDYFIYGESVYEIVTALNIANIYGQSEYNVGFKIEARMARKGQFDLDFFKKILEDNNVNYLASSAQKVFQQQRGLDQDLEGKPTGDKRQMRKRLKKDMAPIALDEGPRVVNIDSEANDETHEPEQASSFDNNTPQVPGVPDIYNE